MLSALAAAPILAVLGLMLGRGWSAARAGTIGLGLALLLALSVFDLTHGGSDGAATPLRGLVGAGAEAAFTSLTILWIIWPALCIHALQVDTGCIAFLQAALARLADDRIAQLLLVGWFFALFMEGAAGFGAPVALAAPLLVSLGLAPVRALTVALIGHAAGVSFGAVGTPILPQIAATGLSGQTLAVVPAVLHGCLGWVLALALMREAGEQRWALGLLAAGVFFVPFVAIALLLGPELPTLGGALIGGAVFASLLRLRRGRVEADEGAPVGKSVPRPAAAGRALTPWARDLAAALAPYLGLVSLIVLTRLPAARDALECADLSWRLWERFSGSFTPLYHPGTMLMASFVLGWVVQRATPGQACRAIRRGTRQILPVIPALFVMLTLARILVHAGMIDRLALDASAVLSGVWPPIAPFIGLLGTFVTGSATTSNILFTEFQAKVASQLDLPLPAILGAQTFGAAVGNILCPHNVVAGCATIGLVGQEAAILRRTIPVGLLYALLGGLLVWAFAFLRWP